MQHYDSQFQQGATYAGHNAQHWHGKYKSEKWDHTMTSISKEYHKGQHEHYKARKEHYKGLYHSTPQGKQALANQRRKKTIATKQKVARKTARKQQRRQRVRKIFRRS